MHRCCKSESKYCINYKRKNYYVCDEHHDELKNSTKDFYYNQKTGKLVVNRIRRARHDKLTGLPTRYTQGLTPSQKLKYRKTLKESQAYYKKTGLVKTREPVSKTLKTTRSKHVIEFEKRYGFSVSDIAKVKKMFPDTDVDKILAKGRAAYASGSRPSVVGRGGIEAWSKARLSSTLTAGRSLAIDKDLVGPKSLKIIYGK